LIVDHADGQSELPQDKAVFEMTPLEKRVSELLDSMEAQFPSQVPVCPRQKAEPLTKIPAPKILAPRVCRGDDPERNKLELYN